jgi:hypothetical protein
MGIFRNFMCRFIGCQRCHVYDTAEGIGGKCIDCGKVHGWVTRAELRAYADRMVPR